MTLTRQPARLPDTRMRRDVPGLLASMPDCRFPMRYLGSGLLAALASMLLVVTAVGQGREIYDSAVVDSAYQLHIHTSAHHDLRPAKDSDQVGFDQPAISRDRRAVGWLSLYPNCCTSYPIPLKLVVLNSTGVHTFDGNGLAVWRWRFDSTGTRVAYFQDVVHGGVGGHYELRDVQSGRLVAEFDPVDSTPMPPWVTGLVR